MRHFPLLRCTTLALWLPFTLVSAACSDDGDVVELDGDTAAAGSGGSTSGSGGSGAGDTTAPTVVSNQPLEGATGESTGAAITVFFSEAMEPLTGASFSLKRGAVAVPGVVSYLDRQALFTPTNALLVSTGYTATVTTGAQDRAGNALSETHTWSFETDASSRRTTILPRPAI